MRIKARKVKCRHKITALLILSVFMCVNGSTHGAEYYLCTVRWSLNTAAFESGDGLRDWNPAQPK